MDQPLMTSDKGACFSEGGIDKADKNNNYIQHLAIFDCVRAHLQLLRRFLVYSSSLLTHNLQFVLL